MDLEATTKVYTYSMVSGEHTPHAMCVRVCKTHPANIDLSVILIYAGGFA